MTLSVENNQHSCMCNHGNAIYISTLNGMTVIMIFFEFNSYVGSGLDQYKDVERSKNVSMGKRSHPYHKQSCFTSLTEERYEHSNGLCCFWRYDL